MGHKRLSSKIRGLDLLITGGDGAPPSILIRKQAVCSPVLTRPHANPHKPSKTG